MTMTVSKETEVTIPAGLVESGDYVFCVPTQDWEYVVSAKHNHDHSMNLELDTQLAGTDTYVVSCDKELRVVRREAQTA